MTRKVIIVIVAIMILNSVSNDNSDRISAIILNSVSNDNSDRISD